MFVNRVKYIFITKTAKNNIRGTKNQECQFRTEIIEAIKRLMIKLGCGLEAPGLPGERFENSRHK